MRLIEKEIEYESRKDSTWYLIPFGDFHFGHPNCDVDLLEKYRDWIKERDNVLWLGMGDYCLRPSAEILTKDGFKKYNEVTKGDIVAGYQDGELVWQKLSGVYFTPKAEFKNLKSKSFNIDATAEHDWLIQMHSRNRDNIRKRKTIELTKANSIIVSAKNNREGEIDLKPLEAGLIGWLVTDGDGRITTRNHWNCNIAQFKEPFRTEIEEKYREFITTQKEGANRFHIKANKIREILNKLDVNPDNLKSELPKIVTRLNPDARKEMLWAMLKAEGWHTGKREESWYFSQKPGPVLEAFQILATLEGYRLSLGKFNDNGVFQQKIQAKKDRVNVEYLEITNSEPGPAWCPITELGNWITRFGNQITITGNCDAIDPKDFRFDYNSVEPEYASPDKQYIWVQEFLEPITDKCIGLLHGNHDIKHWKKHGHNYVDVLSYQLGVDYLTIDSYVRLKFKRLKAVTTVNLYAHHGWTGARTKGGKVNRIQDLADIFPGLELYLMGHVHERGHTTRIHLFANREMRLEEKEMNFYFTGAYLKGYEDKSFSYVEEKTYKPTALGSPIIKIEIEPGGNTEHHPPRFSSFKLM